MFCEKCGAQLHDDAQFCRSCNVVSGIGFTAPLPAPKPVAQAPKWKKTFSSFTSRERSILIGIVLVPLMLFLLPSFVHLIPWDARSLREVFFVSITVLQIAFFVAVLIVSGISKKWKLLWPLIIFCILPLVTSALNLIQSELFFALDLSFESAIMRVSSFVIGFISAAIVFVRVASVVLAVVYVGHYFKARQSASPSQNLHQ